MALSNSNIIPFPISQALPVMKAPSLQERALQFAAAVSTDQHNALSDDHAVHVAAVVRASIRFARRKGARLDSCTTKSRPVSTRPESCRVMTCGKCSPNATDPPSQTSPMRK